MEQDGDDDHDHDDRDHDDDVCDDDHHDDDKDGLHRKQQTCKPRTELRNVQYLHRTNLSKLK